MTNHLRSLTLEQKIGQLFFIGIAGPTLDDAAGDLLAEISPGGVCLFARNIRESRQTRDLLDNIRAATPVIPFLSIDQEGGLVDRLRRVMTPMPAAERIGTVEDAGRLADIIAETLRILGFNMNFAPVVDVVNEERSRYTNGLASRTFGRSRDDVVRFAGEFLRHLQDGGVTGCLKHFPGLAAARVDSHEELPVVEISETELRSTDLFPYTELPTADIRAIMVAHASFPGLSLQETDQNGKLLPSSLSYNVVTELLRRELQFDGLVITDDLEMGAIAKNYGIGDACKRAVSAGVDMLAICADPSAIREGYYAILDAAKQGDIEPERIEKSLERVAHARNQLCEPLQFSHARLKELSTEIAVLDERSSR